MIKKIILNNIIEEMVEEKISELINKSQICKCEQCYKDVKAISLNELPVRYTGTDKGKVIARCELLGEQGQTDITKSIIAAIIRVSNNPHHGLQERGFEND